MVGMNRVYTDDFCDNPGQDSSPTDVSAVILDPRPKTSSGGLQFHHRPHIECATGSENDRNYANSRSEDRDSQISPPSAKKVDQRNGSSPRRLFFTRGGGPSPGGSPMLDSPSVGTPPGKSARVLETELEQRNDENSALQSQLSELKHQHAEFQIQMQMLLKAQQQQMEDQQRQHHEVIQQQQAQQGQQGQQQQQQPQPQQGQQGQGQETQLVPAAVGAQPGLAQTPMTLTHYTLCRTMHTVHARNVVRRCCLGRQSSFDTQQELAKIQSAQEDHTTAVLLSVFRASPAGTSGNSANSGAGSSAGSSVCGSPGGISSSVGMTPPRAQLYLRQGSEFGLDLLLLCRKCARIFSDEERVLQLAAPLYVFGDLHGNMHDLAFFQKHLWTLGMGLTAGRFLFMGDYVDRGMYSLEVVAYLLAYKAAFPGKVFMLRGNHETRAVNGNEDYYQAGCFRRQCTRRFGPELGMRVWEGVNRVFDCLPMAAVVDGTVFCTHGGVPRPTVAQAAEEPMAVPVTPHRFTSGGGGGGSGQRGRGGGGGDGGGGGSGLHNRSRNDERGTAAGGGGASCDEQDGAGGEGEGEGQGAAAVAGAGGRSVWDQQRQQEADQRAIVDVMEVAKNLPCPLLIGMGYTPEEGCTDVEQEAAREASATDMQVAMDLLWADPVSPDLEGGGQQGQGQGQGVLEAQPNLRKLQQRVRQRSAQTAQSRPGAGGAAGERPGGRQGPPLQGGDADADPTAAAGGSSPAVPPPSRTSTAQDHSTPFLDADGFGASPRGDGVACFGRAATDDFLQRYEFSHVIRAHQAQATGVSLSKGAKVITVFSTSKDHGCGKDATCGCLLLDDGKISCINRSARYKISTTM
jgi:uncharacterized membrane protein YgcG